jgi:transposase
LSKVGKPIHDSRPSGSASLRRHEIADDHWERIKDFLPGQVGDPGVTAKDYRLFVDAILWIGRTGAQWRDLAERFGPWNSAWKRFDRWAKKGVWRGVFEELKDPDLEWMILDSTVIRARQDAAGKKGGKAARPSAARVAASGPSSPSRSTGWATRLTQRGYDQHLD